MKKVLIGLTLVGLADSAIAQKKSSTNTDGFKTLESGLSYKILYDAPGGSKPKTGDFIDIEIVTKISNTSIGDSVIFNTREMNGGKPVQFQVQNAQFKGDLIEGVFLMTAGDSAIFKIPVDSLLKANAAPQVDWMKAGTGQMLSYHTTLVAVKSSEQMEKERTANAVKQIEIDEKLLQDYFTKNKIKATKTESGLYYKIDKEGNGIKANTGDTVVVNYTGMTMDGKKFDSNVDPQFMHMEPFTFPVGLGMVIKGWDEGFKIFKKGTKGTLYIPSYLAYGDRSPDPSKIPNNGILLFDIEMVDVKPAAKN